MEMKISKKQLMWTGGSLGSLFAAGALACTTDFVDSLLEGNPNAPSYADAVIVFAGGPNRVKTAFEISGTSPSQKILISGAARNTTLDATLEALNMDRFDLKVPPQNITYGRRAITTVGNAMETANWLKRHPEISSITVVTSREHVLRASYELDRLIPDSIKVEFRGVKNPNLTAAEVWEERQKLACAHVDTCRDEYRMDSEAYNLRRF